MVTAEEGLRRLRETGKQIVMGCVRGEAQDRMAATVVAQRGVSFLCPQPLILNTPQQKGGGGVSPFFNMFL